MLYYETVNQHLKNILFTLMKSAEFKPFRLVGGTSLSLQLGHRMSVDIDLFTDAYYKSLDFDAIDDFLKKTFPFVDYFSNLQPGIGRSYVIGTSREENIKLDVFYTDTFIHPLIIEDTIRLASLGEIAAMKIDVVQRGGRKKDFWDLHQLFSTYSLADMLELHRQRYEYDHDEVLILKKFTDFHLADEDFDPVCLKGKYWAFIKEDIEEVISNYHKK